jgi:hypothetical protein
LVIDGLHILGVPMSFQDFVTHFLDEALFQNEVHIDIFPPLGNIQVVLGFLFSCVIRQFSYLTQIVLPFSLLSLMVGFNNKCKYVGRLWVQGHGSLFKAL